MEFRLASSSPVFSLLKLFSSLGKTGGLFPRLKTPIKNSAEKFGGVFSRNGEIT